jgi:hypothetical protein
MFQSTHPHYDHVEHASMVQDRNSVHLYNYVRCYNAFYKKSVLLKTESGSELLVLYDWRFTANQLVLAPPSPLRPTTSNFIFQLNTCGYSLYVTSSLTRRWICPLELLLVLASAVILRSESRGTQDHILLSQI